MRVLLANSTCKVGGVSTFMLSLRRALVAQGHQCELFFFSRGNMEPYLPQDCPVHFGSLADCLRLIARERIDVVHANNVDWPTGICAVRQLGVKLIVTAHKLREENRTYGWTTRTCDAFTTVSRWIGRALQPFTDLPIRVVYNGIDLAAFHPGHMTAGDRPIVAWVGRGSSPWKRLDKFAAIAPALHAAGARLWIIDQQGPDHDSHTFPAAVAALRSLVERWEGVSFDRMPDTYREIAASGGCVVSTSEREGLGLAFLEAQACGCVVFGPDVRGVNEAVSPDAGGVLYPFDAPPLAVVALVLDTITNRERLHQCQRAAADRVAAEFGVEHMAAEYVRVYRNAPYPPSGSLLARSRARLRLSPLLHWKSYVEDRWGVGYDQYESARQLEAAGEWRLAAGVLRASVLTCPTLYVKPRRLAHFLRAHLRG